MKKILVLFIGILLHVSAFAVNYCAGTSWGYAGTNVTGGGNATPTLVSNESELSAALNTKNSVIIITQDITVTNHISTDKNNLTIMALPGKKLISNKQNATESGILYLKGNNLLLRNLIFEGPGAFDCDGWDNLCLDKATNVWVDHCDFQDGCDGNFDIKSTSDNITVTWCRFRYLKAPRPRDAGDTNQDHTDDHRFSNLVGSGSNDKPSDGTYNITYAFCWWDEGCKQRMTRCRNCELHFLNCYWNSSVADYYVGPQNAKCYFEGCTFSGKANSPSKIWSDSYGGNTNLCTFVHCTGNLPDNTNPGVSAPSYSYDQLSAATAKSYVTDASCGAGATLSVTSGGEVSSPCGGVDPTPVDSTIVSGEYCINLGLGEEPNVRNGGVPEGCGLVSISASLNADKGGKWDQGFMHMGANSDYISFDFSAYDATLISVTFDVTIPNWASDKNTIAYHWNTSANTSYPISSAETETVTLNAPENATSFTIQRNAGKGTRISEVCFQVQGNEPTENISPIFLPGKAKKIIREGRLLILRDNKTFDITGRQVY